METATTPAVLLLNLPNAALAGIDLLSFTVTPRFRGIKNVPSSLHFLFTGSTTALSIRHGLWFRVVEKSRVQPQLFIAKWDAKSETLIPEINEAELLRWRANIGEFWREGLAPYRQSSKKDLTNEDHEEIGDWPILTSYISEELLTRITQGDNTHWSLTSASSAKRDLDEIPGLSSEESDLHPEKELRFLPIDFKRTWREGAVGRERTDAAQDRSWALHDLINTSCHDADPMEVVGELQFCFLMVLTLNNWSCLEQWRRLLTLLFTCRAAVITHPDLFIRAIAALRLQLQHCQDAEGGLIDLADEGGSLLRDLLTRFRKGLDALDSIDVQDVVDELDDLEAYLRAEHGWQFGGTFVKSGVLELEDGEQVRMDTTDFDEDDETGEYAPQFIDLTPEQMRMLNLDGPGDLNAKLKETTLHEDSAESDAEDDEEARSDRLTDDEEEQADLEDMDSRY